MHIVLLALALQGAVTLRQAQDQRPASPAGSQGPHIPGMTSSTLCQHSVIHHLSYYMCPGSLRYQEAGHFP
jgi:hypothetical protein